MSLVLLIRDLLRSQVEGLRERLGEGTAGVFGGSLDAPEPLRTEDRKNKTVSATDISLSHLKKKCRLNFFLL